MSFFHKGNESASDETSDDETTNEPNQLNDNIDDNDDENTENKNIELLDKTIIIFGEIQGRKVNTFIIGCNFTVDEYKTTLEKMKKSFGCGGSLKFIKYNDKTVYSIHLQGNQIKKAEDYLIKNTTSLKIIAKYL